MKILRIALMSFGGFELLRLTYLFLNDLNTNPRFLEAKDFVQSTGVKMQDGVSKGVEVTQTGLSNSAEAVQGGLGFLVQGINSNGLFIVLLAILAIYFIRRSFKQGSATPAKE
ncbi:MAG: hypothetical protein KC422_10040 [Trueperaceae bacterium]|nr:hypothetical protein [Trueperaceae bacterium]